MRPYIISHMMTSVDGRIDCPMVGQLSTDEYYIALEKLGPCSKLSGRITTALECSAVKEESTPMEGTPIGHKSVYVANKSDEYTIIVDTYGKLRWQEGEADGHPLLCSGREQVSEKYLETLRTSGISWIATGAERIDLPQAMELLCEHFGVECLAIVGGGLIDEVSIMVAPGIDGRKGQTAVFDGISRVECNPYKLKLESVEQWEADIVWLRYKVK